MRNKDLEVLNDLVKAIIKAQGEGSRGGKVIGHTRSGKPIYENSNHPDHKGFSSSDHLDAAKAHDKSPGFMHLIHAVGQLIKDATDPIGPDDYWADGGSL